MTTAIQQRQIAHQRHEDMVLAIAADMLAAWFT